MAHAMSHRGNIVSPACMSSRSRDFTMSLLCLANVWWPLLRVASC